MRFARTLAVALIPGLLAAAPLPRGEVASDVRARYTKYEHRIPMRDGRRLFTAGRQLSHPALKAVSPQAPVTNLFMGDDSFHNGAFMLAANFSFYLYFPPRGHEPKPPASETDPFDYGTPDGYDFMRRLGPLAGTRRYLGDNPYFIDHFEHTTYDAFWKARNIAAHLKNIKPAVLTVGGWFDAEDLVGPLLTYRTIEQASPGAWNAIVMGPWSHGGWARGDGARLGNLDFGSQTGVRERPRPPRALPPLHRPGHALRLHDRGPALRRQAARRRSLRDRAARGGARGLRATQRVYRSGSSASSLTLLVEALRRQPALP